MAKLVDTSTVVDYGSQSPPRIGTVARQPPPLSRRQREVLQMMARGLSTGEIATQLSMSENTVRVHLTRTLRKLGLQNRVEATHYAIREGLVEL